MIEPNESEQRWQEVESYAHARCGALNFNGDVQSYDARSSKHVDIVIIPFFNFLNLWTSSWLPIDNAEVLFQR